MEERSVCRDDVAKVSFSEVVEAPQQLVKV